jgi:hypothetical protein
LVIAATDLAQTVQVEIVLRVGAPVDLEVVGVVALVAVKLKPVGHPCPCRREHASQRMPENATAAIERVLNA